MKLACFVLFLLTSAFSWTAETAVSDAAVTVFIDEVKHALRSQWEILQNVRQHILTNKVWLAHLLAELKEIQGATRVNRRNSPNAKSFSEADNFLGNLDDILSELQGLESVLNQTHTGWEHNNHIDVSKVFEESSSYGIPDVGRLVGMFANVTQGGDEGTTVSTTRGDSSVVSGSTTPAPFTAPVFTELREVVSALEELNQRFIDRFAFMKEDNASITTTALPSGELDAVVAQLNKLGRGHLGRTGTSAVQTTTTQSPTKRQFKNLSEVIESLRHLASYLRLPLQVTTTVEDSASLAYPLFTSPTPPVTCEPPLQEIAYRMCILQVTDKRLNWFHARHYCRSLGGELAQDSVVIKTRRYLNDLYGEEGTRVRWPFWVGGYEVSDDEGWRWQWQDGGKVPDFLWSHKQPRFYSSDQTPRGTCMTLDGFQAFYGASLPCHLRRRFVCQMWK